MKKEEFVEEPEERKVTVNAIVPIVITVLAIIAFIVLYSLIGHFNGGILKINGLLKKSLVTIVGCACGGVVLVAWYVYILIWSIRRKKANYRHWHYPLYISLIVTGVVAILVIPPKSYISSNILKISEKKTTITITDFNNANIEEGTYKIDNTNISFKKRHENHTPIYETTIFINDKQIFTTFWHVYLDENSDNYTFYLESKALGNVQVYRFTKQGEQILHLDGENMSNCQYNYIEQKDGIFALYTLYTTEQNGEEQATLSCYSDDISNYCPTSSSVKIYQEIGTDRLIETDKYECVGKSLSKDVVHVNKTFEERPSIYVFKDINELNEKIGPTILKQEDFDDSNYALVPIPYNSCSGKDIEIKNYNIKDNKITVNYYYTDSCGVCALIYDTFLVKVDKSITEATVKLEGFARNNIDCDPNVSYKPMIYLYPTKITNVTVKLGYPELLTTTYPKYDNSWEVIAYPNGDLEDKNNKTYYGLYWEGFNNIKTNFADGFVVKKEDTIAFLEEKLSILGLNEREANEFIVYWLPILEQNKYNLIRFESINEINKQMPLIINPTPDSVIRVLMEYKPLNEEVKVKEQKLKSPQRTGFTVVEWGGTMIQ